MLRASRSLVALTSRAQQGLLSQAQQQAGSITQLDLGALNPTNQQQYRHIGGDKIPQYWGRPSPYTGGTEFLGTPTNHMDLIKKRPLAPDVVEIDGKHMHYKFPWAALSSITNRATGVALSVGSILAAYMALRGTLPGTVEYLASSWAIVLFPFKFAVSYTILYHWLGGIRHVVWDHQKIGNQTDRSSLLELPTVELSSKALFAGSAVLSFIAACM